jgi:hypothetical protein
MSVYCNSNCCPYGGMCGNGLAESDKVSLMRNMRTSSLGVVAAEDIGAGEVLGQYLGEIEHVRASCRDRPRNRGYRLVMKTRPERPVIPVRVAINAESMGGLMRFVNHSCEPVAEFREVANGRRSTVVVATTGVVRHGEEITVDYGDDLWFVCRCGADTCRHRDIQRQRDPQQVAPGSEDEGKQGKGARDDELYRVGKVCSIACTNNEGSLTLASCTRRSRERLQLPRRPSVLARTREAHLTSAESLGFWARDFRALRARPSAFTGAFRASTAPSKAVEAGGASGPATAVFRFSLSDLPSSRTSSSCSPTSTLTAAQRDHRYAAEVLERAQPDPNFAVAGMQMVKLTGSPNYKIAEINRLLTFVEEHLPLGKTSGSTSRPITTWVALEAGLSATSTACGASLRPCTACASPRAQRRCPRMS